MKKQPLMVLDVLGISSASLCMIHCLLFPLLSIIPFGFSNNHWIDVFFACIGMFVVSKVILSSATTLVKIILCCAITLIIGGVVLELLFNRDNSLIIIGGLLMIFGHILNFKTHSRNRQKSNHLNTN